MGNKREIEAVIISNARLGSNLSKSTELQKYLDTIKCRTVIFCGETFSEKEIEMNYWKSDDYKIFQRLFKMIGNQSRIYLMSNNKKLRTAFKMLGLTRIVVGKEFSVVIDGHYYFFKSSPNKIGNKLMSIISALFLSKNISDSKLISAAKSKMMNRIISPSENEISMVDYFKNNEQFKVIRPADFSIQVSVIEFADKKWNSMNLIDEKKKSNLQMTDSRNSNLNDSSDKFQILGNQFARVAIV